jgi:hypothetical protein
MHSTELIRCNVSPQSCSIVNPLQQSVECTIMNRSWLIIEMSNNFYTRRFGIKSNGIKSLMRKDFNQYEIDGKCLINNKTGGPQ